MARQEAEAAKKKEGSRNRKRSSPEPVKEPGNGPGLVGFIKNRHFIKSLRFDINFLYIILFDVLYYAVLASSIMFFMYRVFAPNMKILQNANLLLQQLTTGQQEILQSEFTALSTAYQTMIASVIIISIILLLNHAFFKSLIWKKLLNMRYSIRFAGKALVMTVFLFLSFIALVYAGYGMFKDTAYPIYLLLILFLFMHFCYIIYPMLAFDNSLKSCFRRLWRQGFGKIHIFILPYFTIISLLFVLLFIVKLFQFLPIKIYQVILIMALIAYVSWSKQYILSIIYKLNPK